MQSLIRRTFCALGFFLSTQFSAAENIHPKFASPSHSSRFLPTRMVPSDPVEVRKFSEIAAQLRTDSTHHWAYKNGKLEITHDMLMDFDSVIALSTPMGALGKVSAGSSNANVTGNANVTVQNRGENLIRFLSDKHGLHFNRSGNASGTYRPNDNLYPIAPQWALHNPGTTIANRPGKVGVDVNIEKVWDKFSGSDTLVIAVVDAGFNFKHPDLMGRHWINKAEANGKPGVDDDNNGFVDDSIGWDFVEGDNNPQDYHGHGTFCSSIIAANFDNKEGIAGMVPQCKIMPVRVLDASGHGSQTDIANGIKYAVNNGAKVINFSIGGDGDTPEMKAAFQYANSKGVPIVVAAGNEGVNIDSFPSYPANYPYDNIIVAAAHDHAGLLCTFSNYGKTNVDLAAPGELVIVAGIPDTKEFYREDFEAVDLSKWAITNSLGGTGGFALSTAAPMDGKQSLVWTANANTAATTVNYIDMTGKQGCVLKFLAQFTMANQLDVLIIEGNVEGSQNWNEIGVIGSTLDSGNVVDFGLQGFDNTKFKLRFRTALPKGFSSTNRKLKIDDVIITAADPNPPTQAAYPVIAGTSIAAPHITAYIGLQRLACDRMGIPWTRTLALQGVVQEPAFAGKMATGGRLDVYKGLDFYLSTLPNFLFVDSTALTWHVGEKAQYTLELVPPPSSNYQYTVRGLDSTLKVDGAGKFTWTPPPKGVGSYTVTLTAQGSAFFRKQFELNVVPGSGPVNIPFRAASHGEIFPRVWNVAGIDYPLSASLLSGKHFVVITTMDALGKKQLLKKGWFEAADFKQPVQLLPFHNSITQLQVFVDGILLARAAG